MVAAEVTSRTRPACGTIRLVTSAATNWKRMERAVHPRLFRITRTEKLRQHAFSLIEIMVSVSLLAVIMVGLLAMFYQVQRAFRIGTAQADILEGGRAAMNLIVRDLQEMTASQYEFVTNCVIEPALPLPLVTSVQDLATGSVRDNYLSDISLLTRKNDEWIGTAYRVSGANNGVGALYRFVTNQFADTLPQTTSNIVSEMSRDVSRSTPGSRPYDYALVADGIVSFNIIPYDTNGVRYIQNLPPNHVFIDRYGVSVQNTNSTIDPAAGIYQFRNNDLPAYVDVELAVLEPSALAKFRVREETAAIDGGTRAREFLKSQIGKTHVFRQRVPIRSAATDIGVRY